MRSYFQMSIVFMLLPLLLLASGCSQVTKVDVPQTLASANTKMTNGNLDGAKADYEMVLTADPANSEANFCAGMLGVLDVAIDANTRSLVAKFGYTMPTNLNGLFSATGTASAGSIINLAAYTRAAATPTITPGEIQAYVKNTLIPHLDTALARLAAVEADPNFKYTLTASLTKGNMDRELDLGEIYTLDVLGSLIKGGFHELIAYNWDYVTSTPLSEEAFGKLKSDGAANMQAALAAYDRAMTKWISGLNYINSETDNQTDDLIPQFSNPAEKATWIEYLGLIKNSIENGNTTIEVIAGKNIILNLKAYYTLPVADWKVFNTGAIGYFPPGYDFTINGLFPAMTTSADWSNLAN